MTKEPEEKKDEPVVEAETTPRTPDRFAWTGDEASFLVIESE